MDAEQLRRLVATLDAVTAHEGFNLRPALLRVEEPAGDPDGFLLGWLDLEGGSVSDALLGLVAPESWTAIGTVTGGWVGPAETFDEPDALRGRFAVRPSSHPDSVRARCFQLMGRDGTSAGRITIADGRTIDDVPELGLAVDAMRRAFALPTPPAAFAPAELMTSIWLGHVADAAASSLRQIVRLHPGSIMLEALGERLAVGDFVEAASALGRVLTWTDVRRHARQGCYQGVDRELAAWMDEGMLARWLMSAYPPMDVLVRSACQGLRPAVAGELRAMLAELGVARAA